MVFAGVAGKLELEGAELVVDDLPDDFVGGHGGLCVGCAWSRVGIIGFSFGCVRLGMRLTSLRYAVYGRGCERIGGGYVKSGVWVELSQVFCGAPTKFRLC